MKTLIFVLAVFALAASQTMPPDLPDFPADHEIIQCIDGVIQTIPETTQQVTDWMRDTTRTVIELVEARRNCLDMNNERLRDICLTTWMLQLGIEALRLRNDLAVLTDPETADWFFYTFYECFGLIPELPQTV